MAKPTVLAVSVMGEGLSLPLTFGTLRAMRDAGVLPSTVLRKGNLVDEVAAVDTLVTVARLCGRQATVDQVVASATMGALRQEATAVHIALVVMFGPEEETPGPKGEGQETPPT